MSPKKPFQNTHTGYTADTRGKHSTRWAAGIRPLGSYAVDHAAVLPFAIESVFLRSSVFPRWPKRVPARRRILMRQGFTPAAVAAARRRLGSDRTAGEA